MRKSHFALSTIVILAIAAISVILLRYEFVNKQGWGTARLDRWTGKVILCDAEGCQGENRPTAVRAELYDGTVITFPSGTQDSVATAAAKAATLEINRLKTAKSAR